jgi:hypothetical protein
MKRAMSVLVLGVCAAVAAGQPPAPKPPEKPAETPPTTKPSTPPPPPTPAPAAQTPPAAVPSLDEALGLAKPSDKPKEPPAGDKKPEISGDLDKALDGKEAGDELHRAVALMEQSAKRLEGAKDTSLETQRVQEETVRLLDALIKKNSQKQNSKNKPQQKPQDQQKGQQQPNQSQQSQADQRPQQTPNPNDSPDRGGSTSATLRPGIDAARAAWGNLPQRVRQLLMQGSGDSFSKEYQRLTEEYYKRLGEQGN